MQSDPIQAQDRASAIALIERQKSKLVELDYQSGSDDYSHLARLGQQHGVTVLFAPQQAVLIDSLDGLRRGLEAAKTTWRSRQLLCQFNLNAIPADDAKQLWARASQLGDLIVPANGIKALQVHWK
ncbi:hypothetical protein ACFOHT_03055 [Massilia oculi]|uniref:hypothetical protein n=1 Tax=Massilia oculi TaxID=945844 RepID=UPI0013B3774D|nr:hypothetical protein [Massilia oculi]